MKTLLRSLFEKKKACLDNSIHFSLKEIQGALVIPIRLVTSQQAWVIPKPLLEWAKMAQEVLLAKAPKHNKN
jgi:hypothetical protein